jgi:hypothetical protein
MQYLGKIMIASSYSILLCVLTGFVWVSLCWPNPRSTYEDILIKAPLAAGLGFGITSAIFFLWLLVIGPTGGYFIFEGLLLLFLMVLLFVRVKRREKSLIVSGTNQEKNVRSEGHGGKLWIFFFVLLAIGFMTFLLESLRSPHGEWDAWAIWNLRARFIFRGGEYWKDAFLGFFTHADYPLLLPLSVARIWKNVGREALFAPAIVAFFFTFSTVFLTVFSLWMLRSKSQGYLAGLVLLGTSYFIQHGTSQFADIPVGFFFVATFVLLALHDNGFVKGKGFLCLAGMSAGFSAWTKNEGLLFVLSILIARSLVEIRTKGWRSSFKELAVFWAGLLPILMIVLYFKTNIALSSEFVSLQRVPRIFDLLFDGPRYIQALNHFGGTSVVFTGGILCLPLLVIYLHLVGIKRENRERTSLRTILFTLSLMLIGHFFVYIITPYDLERHLVSSLKRLFLQLWPSFIFYVFMMVRSPEELIRKSDRRD